MEHSVADKFSDRDNHWLKPENNRIGQLVWGGGYALGVLRRSRYRWAISKMEGNLEAVALERSTPASRSTRGED